MGFIKKWFIRFNWYLYDREKEPYNPDGPYYNPRKTIWMEEVGPIDKAIVKHIAELNRKKYTTLNSCSGILKDHLNCPDYPYIFGYIHFKVKKNSIKGDILKIAAEKSGLYYQEDGRQIIVRIPSTMIAEEEDETKMKMWNGFISYIKFLDNR